MMVSDHCSFVWAKSWVLKVMAFIVETDVYAPRLSLLPLWPPGLVNTAFK
jgi:hypothetical protein